jgi:hypothetical protein
MDAPISDFAFFFLKIASNFAGMRRAAITTVLSFYYANVNKLSALATHPAGVSQNFARVYYLCGFNGFIKKMCRKTNLQHICLSFV